MSQGDIKDNENVIPDLIGESKKTWIPCQARNDDLRSIFR